MRVSVIGGGSVDEATAVVAEELGEVLADRGHKVVCGGLSGVMEAVCRGARSVGGHTIGILPGGDRAAANAYVETAIATDINHARNPLVVMNGDAVIAVDGGPGTLSELGHARALDKPVAGLDTHRVDSVSGIEHVGTPAAAVDYVEGVLSTVE
jgi:uncharacterized protein (TIGR00725 family)